MMAEKTNEPADDGSGKEDAKARKTTEYSVYAPPRVSKEERKTLIDFTEIRLVKLINTARNMRRKMLLIALLHDYRKQQVSIAWRAGEPVFVRTKPESA